MKNLILAFASMMMLSSCSVFTKSITVKQLDIYGSGVIQKPVIVDLDVRDAKVSGYSSMAASSSIEQVKKFAVADALKNAKADVLVEPKFEIEKTTTKITASVTGYPANYKNFRSITIDDVPLLEVGIIQKAEVYEPVSSKKSKK